MGSPRRLTPAHAAGARVRAGLLADGRSIAYVSWSDAEGGHVWKAPTAAARRAQLTRAPGHYANPSWSPKGDRLALLRGSGLEFRGRQPEDENFFEILWLDASGGEPEPRDHRRDRANALQFHPQAFWSADGTRLYFREVRRAEEARPTTRRTISSRFGSTAPTRRRYLRFPAVDDLVPSPDGNGSPSPRATTSTSRRCRDPNQRAARSRR